MLPSSRNLRSKVIPSKSVAKTSISNNPKYEHIDVSERQKELNKCVEAEAWLREKQQVQDTLPKYATRVLSSADIRHKEETVDRVVFDSSLELLSDVSAIGFFSWQDTFHRRHLLRRTMTFRHRLLLLRRMMTFHHRLLRLA
ncbi:hypothetical protein MLD38_019389 [Melastoma candidum]|uniref:Uncharacterized protein n=1 Tax=Melastoma candidum TaxID=119954 RepID=A0ACB9QZX6_9MYRT|nr:hypothetical protein MLD38_019389 [Melastoma candidum]